MNTKEANTMTLSTPKFETYTLRYKYGTWHVAETFSAESEEEAIFDADNAERKANNKLIYALFKGNKIIKVYPQSDEYMGLNN